MTILITGANRGIGLALAQEQIARGETVIGTYRTSHPQIAGIEWQRLSITEPASHHALSHTLSGRVIDTVVCNAGVYLDAGSTLNGGLTADIWADTFATNVTGVFLTVEAVMANLRQSDTPKIALISSQMASHERAPGRSYAYRASKAAVLNLGRNMATDLRAQGIAVGIFDPGWVVTDMGGENAEITVTDSARGLSDRLNSLSIDTTGTFLQWNGQPQRY